MNGTAVLGKGKRPGIQHHLALVRIEPDDRSDHRSSAVTQTAGADRRLERIEEHIISGPDLIHSSKILQGTDGRRGADASQHATDTVCLQQFGEAVDDANLLLAYSQHLLPGDGVIRVPGMREQSVKADGGRGCNPLSELQALGVLRIDTGPVISAIDFQQKIEWEVVCLRKLLDGIQGRGVVDQNVQVLDPAGQIEAALQFRRCDGNGVDDILEPCGGKKLRLRQSRDRDRSLPAIQLHSGAFNRLVCLHVGTEQDTPAPCLVEHSPAVLRHAGTIDQERRSLHLPEINQLRTSLNRDRNPSYREGWMDERKIIHVDMDAFYASVEQRDRPELRGKPVVVAWSPEARSVVCAASYEARKFGVRSAMPALRAKRLCPEAVFIKPDFPKYKAVSRQIGEIFQRHTHLVEFLSLDEAFLDVTAELTGIPTATETAQVIRQEIREETGLTASAGVAPNKFLAKIASDWKKPDGLYVIKPSQVQSFLEPLPVGKIPGVGKATAAILATLNIETVGDLRERAELELTRVLGSFGHRLYELARGIDDRPVVSDRESKSFSVENTFDHDLTLEEIRAFLQSTCDRFFDKAKQKDLLGRTITVKLRTGDFRTATRRLTLNAPPATGSELFAVAGQLLERFDFEPSSRYRLAGIGFSGFERSEERLQASLF